MTKQFKILEHDVVFLSYDEPNAEKNYADLLTKCPWAKRVHGVEGSDSAHKACAELAQTERVIIIDADNIVDLVWVKCY
jgi:nicotinamide riboside kinase